MKRPVLFTTIAMVSGVALFGQMAEKTANPEGWMEVPDPSHHFPREYCRESVSWSVENDGRKIAISKTPGIIMPERWSRLPVLSKPLQTAIRKNLGMTEDGGEVRLGELRGIPFAKGWISGYDFGEFGGTVFWVDSKGGSLRKLYRENPIALIPARDGVLILMGSRHMMSTGSAVFLNPKHLEPSKSLPHPVDLSAVPINAVLTRNDNLAGFSILTENGIRMLDAGWNADFPQLFTIVSFQPNLDRMGANSYAISSKDDIYYVGLTDHVLTMKWIPINGVAYDTKIQETWYAHSSCVRRDRCKCVPASEEELKKIVQLP